MRPLYLEMQAFGPFVEKQTVDFEKLSEKGMFLIKGKTGSGKTTIFDAMTFALYGGASGDQDGSRKGRSDLEAWRCTQAPWEMTTYVAFIFSVRGIKYRFARFLEPKRSNFLLKYECGQMDEEGNVVPFSDNPKKEFLNAKAEELIGLKKDQFRQVVLLPQGQFEKFLVASSDEKGEILEKIFDVENWKAYADRFFQDALLKKEELDEIHVRIQNSLSDENLDSLEELEKHIQDLYEELENLQTQHTAFQAEKKQAELNADRELASGFSALHTLIKQKEDLLRNQKDMDRIRAEYLEAEQAEKLRPALEAYETADVEWKKRSIERNTFTQRLPLAEKAEADAKADLERHETQSPVDTWKKNLQLFEQKRSLYESIDKLRREYRQAEQEWKKAVSEADSAEKQFEALTKCAGEYKEAFDVSDKKARDFRDRYFGGIYGEIAQTLKDGDKCPICGSEKHPYPAQKMPDSVEKQDVEKAEQQRDDAKNRWEEAESKRAEYELLKNGKLDEKNKKNTCAETARLKKESAEKDLISGIPDTSALEAEIGKLNEKLKAYEKMQQQLSETYARARDGRVEAQNRKENAVKEEETANSARELAKKTLEEGLEKSGYTGYEELRDKLLSSEKRKEMHEQIVAYDTSKKETDLQIQKQNEQLKGQTEPDASLFDFRQTEISQQEKLFSAKQAQLKGTAERLSKKSEDLKKWNKRYESEIVQAGNDLKFARVLRGDTGMGIQRYVLAVMFNQIIGEANRMLEKVHGGRYQLFRSDDSGTGARKRGLELKVHDSRSPDKDGRGVNMLSGGEKFLVSLALSIGMSTIAQRAGVQIEALFIDEGFGTLDDGSIQDAMDVLDSIRKSSGMIGIISHVQLLEENITNHLEVVKADSGSYLRLS